MSGSVENSPKMPQVMSARWVTGSGWQALLVWSSVSALSVPSPQRRGQTEVSGQRRGTEVCKPAFLSFDAVRAESEGGSGPPSTVTYRRIRRNIP